MSDPLFMRPRLTEAGRVAAMSAKDQGVRLDLTHVEFGKAKYAPNGSETALQAPVSGRLPLTAGDRPTPSQLRLAAIWMQDVGTQHVTEVGFWAGDVLAYVWSTETGQLAAVKVDGVPYVLFVDIGLVNDFETVIQLSVDPTQSVALGALMAHESARDAHPQYLRRDIFPSEMRMMWGVPVASEDPNNVLIQLPEEVELPHYAPGQRFTWRAAHTNTGPMTMDVAGLGALPLKKAGTRDLEPADIEVGCAYDFYFDGDKFQLAVGVSNHGHADSASRLRTPRLINRVPFNGTEDIVIEDDTKEPIIPLGSSGTFYGGDKAWHDVGDAVRGTLLNGLALADGSITAGDTLLVAMGKAQGQIKFLADTKAPYESPAFTGTPTVPTPVESDNSQRIANTAFVQKLFANLVGQAPEAINSVYELAAALGNDPNFATTVFEMIGTRLGKTETAVSTDKLATPRTLIVGNTGKAFDGTSDVAWTLAEIGAQPADGALGALAGLSLAANQMIYSTGPKALAATAFPPFARDLIAAAVDESAARSKLGLGSAALLTATTSVADRTAGRAVRMGDLGIGQMTGPVREVNFNTLPSTYPYSGFLPDLYGGVTGTNTPKAGEFFWYVYHGVRTASDGTVTVLQVAFPYRVGTDGFYMRSRYQNVWTQWDEVPGGKAIAAKYLALTGGTMTGNLIAPSVSTSNWFRSTGNTGWHNETHGGGIMMQDATWVRVNGGKAFYVANQIAATGDITAFYSDARLKENIRGIDNALDAVLSWRGVRYNANELAESFGYDRDKQQVGLLAQDVEKTAPELVVPAPFDIDGETGGSLTGENYKTLKYDRAVPYLVEALREVSERLETAMKRIEQLERAV